MKQKKPRSGITRKHTGVHEPVAEYLSGTGPVIVVDATGRMVLPKKIRDRFGANRFEVRATEDRIELMPIDPFHSLLGALPDIDLEKIYREHDQEADDEDKE
jgi:AbrB family looped-hinge helix DNA binding protein